MVIINLLLLLALHVITIFGYVLMRKWLPSAGFKYQQEPACSAGLGCWEEGRGALDQASIPATNHCLCFGLVVFLFLCFCFWGGCLLGFFFSQQATNFQSLWQDKTWNFFSCKNQSFVRWKSCKLFFFFFFPNQDRPFLWGYSEHPTLFYKMHKIWGWDLAELTTGILLRDRYKLTSSSWAQYLSCLITAYLTLSPFLE